MNPLDLIDPDVLVDVALIILGAIGFVLAMRKAVREGKLEAAEQRVRLGIDNGESVTPVERPCKLPANEHLADVISGMKHAMRGLADRMGDVERTIRLSPTMATPADEESIATIFDDGADVLRLGAHQVRRRPT